MDPIKDLIAKRIKKMSLESTLLVKNKIVLPVKRIRTLQDRIIRLKDNGETPGKKIYSEEKKIKNLIEKILYEIKN